MTKELDEIVLDEKKATGEDSASIDATTGKGGAVKKRKADLKKSVDPKVDEVEDDVKTPQGQNNAGFHEAIEGLFSGSDLTEDFKTKTVAVFEAAVNERAESIREEMEEEFEGRLEEETNKVVDDLVEKVDSYLNYVVEQWMEKNELALESSIKVEVAESLMDNLKGLVTEHNLEIDEDSRDVVAEMEAKLDESKTEYNELFDDALTLKEEVDRLNRKLAFRDVSEGLTETQIERFETLVEGVSYENMDEYTTKIEAVKENYFTESTVTPKTVDETEYLEEAADVETDVEVSESVDPSVAAYAKSLSSIYKN